MTLSLVLTVNNRPPEVSRQVAQALSLPGNTPDQLVVVLDRVPADLASATIKIYNAGLAPDTIFTMVEGEPGWLGPARAWNQGFAQATGDTLMCISSEVVLAEGTIDRMRELVDTDTDTDADTVVFGACHNSVSRNLVVGADPGLLVSSKMPRPLGFIVAMPAAKVREIGGFDESFMGDRMQPGYWYDDDDFFLRLWHTGARFVFDDAAHGIHLDHDRPDLDTPAGRRGIERNRLLMVSKHNSAHPWATLQKSVYGRAGQLTWEHP